MEWVDNELFFPLSTFLLLPLYSATCKLHLQAQSRTPSPKQTAHQGLLIHYLISIRGDRYAMSEEVDKLAGY